MPAAPLRFSPPAVAPAVRECAQSLPLCPVPAGVLTRFHTRLLAEELTLRAGRGAERVVPTLSEARVDLHPHQVEAAAFALDSLARGGCLLADEVGLGKTIEAGIVLAQLLAEGKGRILVLTPATLRAQWQAELLEKFDVDAVVVDGRADRGTANVFDRPYPVISSLPFAAARPEALAALAWDVVVIDEAHRLRNAHRPGHKTGRALRAALAGRPKLLLTATPLQNTLLELFGLLSLLDEELLGPEHAFRSRYAPAADGALPDVASAELKERLLPAVHRTLRRQVREYVRFTNRHSVVEDFAPTPEEEALYQKVSEYLRRQDAAAIEPGQRTLLLLVYRKLLASSTFAIAPTLRTLAEALRRRLKAAAATAEAGLEAEDLRGFQEEVEAWDEDASGRPVVSAKALEKEALELEQYALAAERIVVNAKGEALKRALARIFGVARGQGWPEKAVVFTESRRTQAYLAELLAKGGFAGKLSLLSGDAGTPEQRAALVEEFRSRTQILISTEAGAEGLNLQFCNLVVNYDLPWNPQRIEQRIGRCHRYGQQRDVLVLNFLNRRNAADARLYELLEAKLNLFDGVFGASDEILGALESGLDFERRVLDIYQSCRTTHEIQAAFDALRADLESRIDNRMTQARSLLFEHFDADVRRRLKLSGEEVKQALLRRRGTARQLTSVVLGTEAFRHTAVAEAAALARSQPLDAVNYLQLDAASLPPRLARLAGSEGWWFAYRFSTGGLSPEERLLHLMLVKQGEDFTALPLADAEVLARLPGREGQRGAVPALSVTAAQERALEAARSALLRDAERGSARALDAALERADRYAEDCLLLAREGMEKARAAWGEARARLRLLDEPTERARARSDTERAERAYRRALAALHKEEETRYAAKDRELEALASRARVQDSRTALGTAYFWLV
ncbi:MAG: SNF2-related protein [Myxococcaceae bacterium]